MESDRQKARGLTSVLGVLALVLFLLVAVALVWGSCNEPDPDVREDVIAPPDDRPGPDGAPGVAAPPLAE